MLNFFNKKNKAEEPSKIFHNEATGVVRMEFDGNSDGKGNLPMLEEFAKHSNFPIFKGTIENAYESDFLGYKDKCPLCQTPTVQHFSNFIWANQEASRIATAPAGHFCPNCPTVIIDDDVIKRAINPRFHYWGTCAIDTGFNTQTEAVNLFKTFNGEKPTYILDENEGLSGILGSVHEPNEQTYLVPNSREKEIKPNFQKSLQEKNKKAKNKTKNKQAKQSRKANRKK